MLTQYGLNAAYSTDSYGVAVAYVSDDMEQALRQHTGVLTVTTLLI